jgi:iron complex transport system substrate-binding protein
MRDIEELARIAIDTGLGVHRTIGPGCFESIYEAALALDLTRRGLSVIRQAPISLHYDDIPLGEAFRADLLVENRLVIEVKSIERLSPLHAKQLITYLRLLSLPLGLLMNFGGETFREGLRRVVNDHGEASTRLRVNQVPAIQIEPQP